jgi:hypothetical protein
LDQYYYQLNDRFRHAPFLPFEAKVDAFARALGPHALNSAPGEERGEFVCLETQQRMKIELLSSAAGWIKKERETQTISS